GGHEARAVGGTRHPAPAGGRGAARDVHRRPGRRDPLGERQRPLGRPQRGRGAAGAGRAADRRAVPLQLAEGRADARGGLSMGALEAVRSRLPEAAKDIKLNLQAVLQDGTLSPAQRYGVAIASAITARNAELRDALLADAPPEASPAVVEDARAAAAVMAMNNVYYRFRYLVGKPAYGEKPARLRMNRLVHPASNKLDFELFALAVSAINGCESCVRAHEQAVVAGGLTEDHVNDAVRIAATVSAAAV